MDLCVVEGDKVGHEVIPAALRVLEALLPQVNVSHAEAGVECFQKVGSPLPDETIELARKCNAVLFGAADSPSYPVNGYYSPIVRLRKVLKCYANLRPTRFLPISTARAGVDLIVVRENTEDLYAGEESTSADKETGTTQKIVTRAATERISRIAYDLARHADRDKVTIVHKANIMPQSDGLFRRVALEISANYPEIDTDEMLVDTAAYWMVKEPSRFDVILTSNLYGDILSDMAAAWGGGLGLAPSLNLGEGIAIAEPVHGSAPDIAGKGIANPTASILSVAMLMRHHWGLPDDANRIEEAIRKTLDQGHRTADIQSENAIGTEAFTDKVIENLN